MGNAACCSSQTSQTMDFGDMSPTRMKNYNFQGGGGARRNKSGIFHIIRPETLEIEEGSKKEKSTKGKPSAN